MTLTKTITYRAMSSGYVLKRIETVTDYAIGGTPSRSTSGWKRAGKIKAHLMQNRSALFDAMAEWADQLREKGWDAEIS